MRSRNKHASRKRPTFRKKYKWMIYNFLICEFFRKYQKELFIRASNLIYKEEYVKLWFIIAIQRTTTPHLTSPHLDSIELLAFFCLFSAVEHAGLEPIQYPSLPRLIIGSPSSFDLFYLDPLPFFGAVSFAFFIDFSAWSHQHWKLPLPSGWPYPQATQLMA